MIQFDEHIFKWDETTNQLRCENGIKMRLKEPMEVENISLIERQLTFFWDQDGVIFRSFLGKNDLILTK